MVFNVMIHNRGGQLDLKATIFDEIVLFFST